MPHGQRKIGLVAGALEKLGPLERECTLCPRECRVDRTRGARGVCQTGDTAAVSHALLHFGEEPVLSGPQGPDGARGPGGGRRSGSGTIFFTGCNLKCVFCQNYQISWHLEGEETTDEGLAGMMLGLQAKGALNVNFVSPTHVVVPILRALEIALSRGLEIPLVYNSNGYESVKTIKALDGIVDVYLPDLKYRSPLVAEKYSSAPDYFAKASEAVREMALQQPVLVTGKNGAARKGLIIRHLILPGHGEDSVSVLRWIRDNLSPFIGLSLMSQYHPCFRSPEEIGRPLAREEYEEVTEEALRLGFENLFLQPDPFDPGDHLIPDFRRREPFRWK